MRSTTLGFALVIASTRAMAGDVAEYTREGCWGYCDEGVVVTAMEDIALVSTPPWRDKKQTTVGSVKKSEKLLVVKAETKGRAARLKVKIAKHGFVPTDEVWLFAYTGEGTWAVKHNGETKEFVELGYQQELCQDEAWCEVSGKPEEEIWSYVETQAKVRGWTNSRKLLSPKW